MATATAPDQSRVGLTDQLVGGLSDEPQTIAQIATELGLLRETSGEEEKASVNRAFHLLEQDGLAEKSGRGKYIRSDKLVEIQVASEFDAFPFEPAIIDFDDMFVHRPDTGGYQRPLSSFVNTITKDYNPILMGSFVLSDRGEGNDPARYAVVDGQTRRAGARRRGVRRWMALVATGLTIEDEARIFALLQRMRRNMTSSQRFIADVVAKDPVALAVTEMVKAAGFSIGDGGGKISAPAALEACWKTDQFILERTLFALRAAFPPPAVPAAAHIRGLHRWLRNPGAEYRKKGVQIDDEKLVRRLESAGLEGLKRRANAAAEITPGSSRSAEKAMAAAIDSIYRSR